MSRLPLLSPEETRRRGTELGIPSTLSRLNAFRVLLHNTQVTGSLAQFLVALLSRGAVDRRIRELVILRVGWRTASEYEFCQHVAIARQIGMKEEEIFGSREPEACLSYDARDRAVMRMTDELLDRSTVSDETWNVLRGFFDDAEIVELFLVAGNWRMVAGFLNGLDVPLDDGIESWPNGRRPARP